MSVRQSSCPPLQVSPVAVKAWSQYKSYFCSQPCERVVLSISPLSVLNPVKGLFSVLNSMPVLQACAAELTRGQHVWSQVMANNAAEAFQDDLNGAAYLKALRQVWMIALLLQAAADLHALDQHEHCQSHFSFTEASRQIKVLMTGKQHLPMLLLQIQNLLCSLT